MFGKSRSFFQTEGVVGAEDSLLSWESGRRKRSSWDGLEVAEATCFLPLSPVASQGEALPVYAQWSAGWPGKGGRRFQHRIHPHLLLSSDRYNQGRARIGPFWVSAFQKKVLLTAGDPAVSRTSSGKTAVLGGHLPGVTMVPSALGKWWDFQSICSNSTTLRRTLRD